MNIRNVNKELHYAVVANHYEMAKRALEDGANPNRLLWLNDSISNELDLSGLSFLSMASTPEILVLLLRYGANPNKTLDKKGLISLLKAASDADCLLSLLSYSPCTIDTKYINEKILTMSETQFPEGAKATYFELVLSLLINKSTDLRMKGNFDQINPFSYVVN